MIPIKRDHLPYRRQIFQRSFDFADFCGAGLGIELGVDRRKPRLDGAQTVDDPVQLRIDLVERFLECGDLVFRC